MSPTRLCLQLVILLLLCSATAAVSASPIYSVTLLQPSVAGRAYSSHAFGLNEHGDVVGSTRYSGNDFLAAWSKDGTLIQYPGSASTGQPSIYTDAFGINDSREVFAGNSPTVLIGLDGTLTKVTGTNMLPANPRALNNAGMVVGSTGKLINGRNIQTAFEWTAQTGLVDLGAQVGIESAVSQALAVNQSGEASGSARFGDGYHAALWTNGTVFDLGRLANTTSSQAWGMNDRGAVVGDSMGATEAEDYAFIWTNNGGMRALGALPDYGHGSGSTAYDINNSGQVVGYSGTYNSHIGFYWDEQTGMRRLDELLDTAGGYVGMVILDAAAINDAGQIAATARWNGATTAVLLTPVGVPEPASPALILIVLLGMAVFRRQRAHRSRRHLQDIDLK